VETVLRYGLGCCFATVLNRLNYDIRVVLPPAAPAPGVTVAAQRPSLRYQSALLVGLLAELRKVVVSAPALPVGGNKLQGLLVIGRVRLWATDTVLRRRPWQ
jgi:hypothetical protein